MITRLYRLARSTLDLHRILEQLQENDIGFVVLDQANDTTTSACKLGSGLWPLSWSSKHTLGKSARQKGSREPGPRGALRSPSETD